MSSIRENILAIEDRIQNACAAAGRPRESVRLMAVSKLQPIERIREAIEYGLRLFGESRVQETKSRRDIFPDDAEVHLIGHLQRNKAKDAAGLYHAVQSLDAVRTLEALERRLFEADRSMNICIEVNTSGETSKEGVQSFDDLKILAERVEASDSCNLRGLMTIGPLTGDEVQVRRAFARLREYRDRLEGEMGKEYPELSMGMSGDMEGAIQEGSTMVRIGTAIFGQRVY